MVKKLQLWDISQSNQCEVSIDVKPEMPTESQLLDDFVVLSEVTLNYLLWMVMITLFLEFLQSLLKNGLKQHMRELSSLR